MTLSPGNRVLLAGGQMRHIANSLRGIHNLLRSYSLLDNTLVTVGHPSSLTTYPCFEQMISTRQPSDSHSRSHTDMSRNMSKRTSYKVLYWKRIICKNGICCCWFRVQRYIMRRGRKESRWYDACAKGRLSQLVIPDVYTMRLTRQP
jgi:hypothetical protein